MLCSYTGVAYYRRFTGENCIAEFATQYQSYIAKRKFCIANCDAIPHNSCLAVLSPWFIYVQLARLQYCHYGSYNLISTDGKAAVLSPWFIYVQMARLQYCHYGSYKYRWQGCSTVTMVHIRTDGKAAVLSLWFI